MHEKYAENGVNVALISSLFEVDIVVTVTRSLAMNKSPPYRLETFLICTLIRILNVLHQ